MGVERARREAGALDLGRAPGGDSALEDCHTERMEMGPGAGGCGSESENAEPWELLATLELVEQGGKTHLKMTLLFPTKEGRDGALASGMERGVAAGYDTLDGLLSEFA